MSNVIPRASDAIPPGDPALWKNRTSVGPFDYTYRAPDPATQLNPLVPPRPDPVSAGDHRRWSNRMVAAGDSSNIMVTVQGYRDTAGGALCLATSPRCRSDIFTIQRSINGWCGPAGCSSSIVYQHDMFRANTDNTPISNLPWVDHVLPAAMIFDNGVIANSWYDFRQDPINDTQYFVRESYLEAGGGIEFGPSHGSAATFNPPTVWYGDIDTVALSRLHAVIARQVSYGGGPNVFGYLWAPYAPFQ
jgi:hypothetical protein